MIHSTVRYCTTVPARQSHRYSTAVQTVHHKDGPNRRTAYECKTRYRLQQDCFCARLQYSPPPQLHDCGRCARRVTVTGLYWWRDQCRSRSEPRQAEQTKLCREEAQMKYVTSSSPNEHRSSIRIYTEKSSGIMMTNAENNESLSYASETSCCAGLRWTVGVHTRGVVSQVTLGDSREHL